MDWLFVTSICWKIVVQAVQWNRCVIGLVHYLKQVGRLHQRNQTHSVFYKIPIGEDKINNQTTFFKSIYKAWNSLASFTLRVSTLRKIIKVVMLYSLGYCQIERFSSCSFGTAHVKTNLIESAHVIEDFNVTVWRILKVSRILSSEL